jgi:hypothetical protein
MGVVQNHIYIRKTKKYYPTLWQVYYRVPFLLRLSLIQPD